MIIMKIRVSAYIDLHSTRPNVTVKKTSLAAALCAAVVLCAASTASAQHEDAVAAHLERYFARAYALGQRAINKRHTVELGVAIGVVPTDARRVYLPVGARVAFHATDWLAIEAGFSYSLATKTAEGRALESAGAGQQRQRQRWRASGSVLLSPIDGKLRVGQSVLGFEPYGLLGFGALRLDGLAMAGLEASVRPEWHVGAGLRVCFARRWLLRVEYRQHIFVRDSQAEGGAVGTASEFGVGFGVLLGQ